MNNSRKISLFFMALFILVCAFVSCERDDICADQVITPNLIIRFVDSDDADPMVSNTVVNLQIEYLGDDNDTIVNGVVIEGTDPNRNVFTTSTSTDSITLLLPTFKNNARFAFKQNFNDLDEDDLDNVEIDILSFTYERSEEYVSRACGFKTTYSNLGFTRMEGDGDTVDEGFIDNVFIDADNNSIENEETTHIRISHGDN